MTGNARHHQEKKKPKLKHTWQLASSEQRASWINLRKEVLHDTHKMHRRWGVGTSLLFYLMSVYFLRKLDVLFINPNMRAIVNFDDESKADQLLQQIRHSGYTDQINEQKLLSKIVTGLLSTPGSLDSIRDLLGDSFSLSSKMMLEDYSGLSYYLAVFYKWRSDLYISLVGHDRGVGPDIGPGDYRTILPDVVTIFTSLVTTHLINQAYLSRQPLGVLSKHFVSGDNRIRKLRPPLHRDITAQEINKLKNLKKNIGKTITKEHWLASFMVLILGVLFLLDDSHTNERMVDIHYENGRYINQLQAGAPFFGNLFILLLVTSGFLALLDPVIEITTKTTDWLRGKTIEQQITRIKVNLQILKKNSWISHYSFQRGGRLDISYFTLEVNEIQPKMNGQRIEITDNKLFKLLVHQFLHHDFDVLVADEKKIIISCELNNVDVKFNRIKSFLEEYFTKLQKLDSKSVLKLRQQLKNMTKPFDANIHWYQRNIDNERGLPITTFTANVSMLSDTGRQLLLSTLQSVYEKQSVQLKQDSGLSLIIIEDALPYDVKKKSNVAREYQQKISALIQSQRAQHAPKSDAGPSTQPSNQLRNKKNRTSKEKGNKKIDHPQPAKQEIKSLIISWSSGMTYDGSTDKPKVVPMHAPFLPAGRHFVCFNADKNDLVALENEDDAKNKGAGPSNDSLIDHYKKIALQGRVVPRKGTQGIVACNRRVKGPDGQWTHSLWKLKDPTKNARVFSAKKEEAKVDGTIYTLHHFDTPILKAH